MIALALRVIGVIVVFVGVATIGLGYSNALVTSPVKPDLSFCFWLGPAIIVVGVGSLFLRRWALLLLGVISTIAGLALGIGSLFRVPFPWEFINLLGALLLLVPGVLVRKWWL